MSHLSASSLSRFLLIILVAASFAAGQDIRIPESGINNRMRTELRVDPVSHALQFEIPLGQYPGRAGNTLPITLYYSSKVWNIQYLNSLQCGDDVGSIYRAEYSKFAASGWTTSLGGISKGLDISFQRYNSQTTRPTTSGNQKIARIFITLPDGSRHELRKDDNFHEPTENITGLFYSVDGTRLIYDTTTSTLFMPDGSRYISTSSGQIYIDRNGNQRTYSLSTNQWTDTLGRAIGVPLPTGVGDGVGLSEQEYTYSIPGVGVPYTFRWKHLSTAGVINEQETDQTLRYKGDRISNCQNISGDPALFHSSPVNFEGGLYKQGIFDPVVLSQIVLPTGQSYTFKYNIYGEITKVIYPTGGYERFAYGQAPLLSAEDGVGLYSQTNRGVTNARISPNGATANEEPWSYAGFNTYAPDNSHVERSVYTSIYDWSAYAFEDPRLGLVNDERTYSPSGQMVLRKLTDYAVDGQVVWYSYPAYKQRNPRPIKEVEIVLVPGGNALTTTTTYEYDADLNVSAVNRYDFASVDQGTAQTSAIGVMPQGALLRRDETTYLVNDPNIDASVRGAYRSRNLVALPTSTRVKDGAGNIVAQTSVSYDETNYPLLTYSSLTGWSDPGTPIRGNPTTQGAWLNTSGTYLQTHAQYDQSGNVLKTWDAKGNLSQVSYLDAFSDYSRNTYAYPTTTTSAVPDASGTYGSTTPLSTTGIYDFSTGSLRSSTDANGKTTNYSYDAIGRLTQVDFPDGGRTIQSYVDSHPCGAYVKISSLLDTTGREADSYQFFDGLGRPKRAFTYENQDPSNPYLTVDTQYDVMGRTWRTSNPYRSTGCDSGVNPTGRWTQTIFDTLGRAKQITTPDGAVVSTDYTGNSVTVTDQALRKRRSFTDALGRLVRVDEPNKDTGSLDTGGASTYYTYNVLSDLLKVEQGVQQRFFMYDSLGRLLRAKNVEQGNFTPDAGGGFPALTDSTSGTPNSNWSTGYLYDANGNLLKRRDARNVVTTYAYDALNRNTTVRYTDGTKDIDRHYDGAINGKGRFYYSNWDAANNTRFDTHLAIDQYDAAGRPLNYRQHFLTNGVASPQFNVSRTYDKAGHVLTQTYPSGHTVSYNYDAAGRLGDRDASHLAFTGNLGDGVARTYATGITYSEFGGLQQEQFGTQTALYHKLHYNVRGQLYDVRLSTLSLQANEFDWNRGCLALYYSGYAWGQSGPANNGNLTKQEHYAPADDGYSNYWYTQGSYNYDSLNRLGSTSELHGGPWGQSGQDYIQGYDYDRWGNRTITSGSTISNTQFDKGDAQNTNRLYAPGDTAIPDMNLRQIRYDAAGNQIYDSYSYPGQGARTYDAENHLKQAWANNQWQTYTYDADGRRIKRNVNGFETWQVYGMDGELLAEYQSGAAAFLPATEYGYRGGELLTTITSGDAQRLRRFVTNLYYGAKQTDPTAQQLQDGINQLAAAGVQGQTQLLTAASQLARSLFTSTNYETSTPARTDTQYVSDLYYAYLQRGPDDSGLGWWAGQAASSRVNVCNAFEASGEFQTLVATLYGTAASDNERTEHLVNSFYLGSRGTNATSTELQQQRDALNSAAAQGLSQVQAQAETFGRGLFTAQVNDSSLSNTQYVTNLYEAFLQRGPDSGGLGFWAGQASVGTGRQNVLNAFATCGAFRELAGTLYREANWLVADHLDTPRMVVNKSGALAGVKRHDYLPFGEELFAGTGGRTTTPQGYSGDSVRQKFTQFERDIETGLDFAQARHYPSKMGRFTSPDPLYFQFSMTVDPQQFNLYAYVRNNPLKFSDPDGERVFARGGSALEELYRNVGGKEIFDQYFYVNANGEVLQKPFTDPSGGNSGVQLLAGVIASPKIYIFYAGTDENEAASLFTNQDKARRAFNGTQRGLAPGQGGIVSGTQGRSGTNQPATLPTNEEVFFVLAINTNAVITQSASLAENLSGGNTGTPFNGEVLGALITGAGLRVHPGSIFIHEAAENLKFEKIGFSQPFTRKIKRYANYTIAHNNAKRREAIIRSELHISGGFAGGALDSIVPQRR